MPLGVNILSRDNYEVTVEELDKIVELTLREQQQMVYGSHLSGGGFGGCIVTLLHLDAVDHVKTTVSVSSLILSLSHTHLSLSLSLLQENYRSRHGKKATFVVCYPSGGAGVIDSDSLVLHTPEK